MHPTDWQIKCDELNCLLPVVRLPEGKAKRKGKVHCRMMQNLKDNHEVWVNVLQQEMEEKEREKEREATAALKLPEDITSVRLPPSCFLYQSIYLFKLCLKFISIFLYTSF